jgi:hypothetical protein
MGFHRRISLPDTAEFGEMVRSTHHDIGFRGWNATGVATKFYVMLTAAPVLNILKEGISPYGPATHRAIRVVSHRKIMACFRKQHRAIRVFVAPFVDGCARARQPPASRGSRSPPDIAVSVRWFAPLTMTRGFVVGMPRVLQRNSMSC